MRCCVKACKNHTGRKVKGVDGITFHVFPNDEEVKKQWVKVVDREGWNPSKYSIICSAHFNEAEFYDTKKGLRRLLVGTVPSLNLGNKSGDGDGESAPSRKRRRLSHCPESSNEPQIPGRTTGHITPAEPPLGSLRLGSGTLRTEPAAARPALQRELLSDLQRLSDKVQRLYPAVRGKHFTLTYRGEDGDKCEYVFTSASETRSAGARHKNLGCNECGAGIVGFRYKCVSCADYDLCAACEAIGAHAHHVVMRIASPIKFKQARLLVARWSEAMRTAGLGSLDEITSPSPAPARACAGGGRCRADDGAAGARSDAVECREGSTVKSEVTSPTVPPRARATKGLEAATGGAGVGGPGGRPTRVPPPSLACDTKHEIDVKKEPLPAEDPATTSSSLYNEPTLALDEVKVEEPDPLMEPGEETAAGSVPGIHAHAGNIVIDPTSLSSMQLYRQSHLLDTF